MILTHGRALNESGVESTQSCDGAGARTVAPLKDNDNPGCSLVQNWAQFFLIHNDDVPVIVKVKIIMVSDVIM